MKRRSSRHVIKKPRSSLSTVKTYDRVPLLDLYLFRPCTCLSCHEFLEVAYCVIFVAFHADLLT